MKEYDKYLKLLKEKYPTKQSVYRELINLNAIMNLPKGTEHFMSDLHGEYDAFYHIINNCSGVIKEKVAMLYGDELTAVSYTHLNFILVVAMIVILYKYNLFNNFALLMGLKEETVQLFNTGMNGIVIIFFIIKWILPITSSIVETIPVSYTHLVNLNTVATQKFTHLFVVSSRQRSILVG